jgi:hypothetical protein
VEPVVSQVLAHFRYEKAELGKVSTTNNEPRVLMKRPDVNDKNNNNVKNRALKQENQQTVSKRTRISKQHLCGWAGSRVLTGMDEQYPALQHEMNPFAW